MLGTTVPSLQALGITDIFFQEKEENTIRQQLLVKKKFIQFAISRHIGNLILPMILPFAKSVANSG